MNTSLPRLFGLILLIALTTLVTTCVTPSERATKIAQTTPTKSPTTSVQPVVQVIPSGGTVEERVIFTEEVSQNNCGNSRDLQQSIDRSQSIAYTLEVGGGIKLSADGWEKTDVPGSHWKQGFALARPALDADGIVQTCCLKTHRFGGHFTLSLKNSVGLAAKQIPGERHNYMHELHLSRHQRRMIAEINAAYQPDLILLDGVEAFVEGGPAKGKKVDADIILAGTDRVAIDAVGVALLRYFGTTRKVSKGPIFQQQQIARAVELGLGVNRPEKIDLVTDDSESEAYAVQIREILARG